MKKFLTLIVAFSLLTTTSYAASFTDVNDSTHYNQAINWMADNGIVQGYENGSFGPDICVNRAEMLKILFETLEVDETTYSSETPFPDTEKGAWYTAYAKAGKARGTVQGYTDGNFRPTQSVSRVEAIKMALLEFNNGEIPEITKDFLSPIDTTDAFANLWWYDYFTSAYSRNTIGMKQSEVIPDTDARYYKPNDCMTRKEVSEMIYRMKAIQDNNTDYYTEDIKPNNLIILDQEKTITIETVREAFERKYPNTDYSNYTITIDENYLDYYVSGGIGAPEGGGAHYWAALDSNDQLTIITEAQDSVPCSVFDGYEIPQNLIENSCFEETNTYTNNDFNLSFDYSNNWEISSENLVEIGENTQLLLTLRNTENSALVISVNTPIREVGYENMTIEESELNKAITNLTLENSQYMTNQEGNIILRNAYAKDPEDYFTSIEFLYSDSNTGLFDKYLPDYYEILETTNF